jgi:phage major head subunit gpT-like protein
MFLRTTVPDLFLQTMLPAIDEIVQERYARWPTQYTQVFRMRTTSRGIEQTTEVTGFGQMNVVPETSPVPYSDPLPGLSKTYLTAQYGMGFKVSRLAKDDDRHGTVAKFAGSLGKSAAETKEVVHAAVFNSGFTSTVGPDGKALFDTAHPLMGGSTRSNRAAAASDPDMTSIGLALTDMRKMKDHNGKKLRIPAKKAIFPPDLEFIGSQLMGGVDDPSTANRALNPFMRRSGMPSFSEWMVWDYLTDAHAWFIEGDVQDTELRSYEHEAFNTIHDVDFDTRSLKTAGWMRFATGFNGDAGIYGVPSS